MITGLQYDVALIIRYLSPPETVSARWAYEGFPYLT